MPAVDISNLSKSFSGVSVLNRVSLDIEAGEVHGLVGENGSGKSTLVKILGGVHSPDNGDGSVVIFGKPLQMPITHPQRNGIAIVHQDLALVDGMSVFENMGISTSYSAKMLQPFSKNAQRVAVKRLASQFQIDLDPDANVADLSSAERSVVAILRALTVLGRSHQGNLIILDEPTASLPYSESEKLLAIMRKLAAAGNAVLFVGHRLQEVLSVCDRVSVLRSGTLVGTVRSEDMSENDLVTMMLGYELGAFYPEKHALTARRNALEIRDMSGPGVSDFNLSVAAGEIVGVTGLVGMGQDELPYLIYGSMERRSGEVSIQGQGIKPTIGAALDARMVLVPCNRARDSVWADGSSTENMTIPFVERYWRRGTLRKRAERLFAQDELVRFSVRPRDPDMPLIRFSGGNQQKVVLARWLQVKPRVLLLHEPTQGIDVGAKKDLYDFVRDIADGGTAVVMFSSDIEEMVNVCHRVVILRYGVVTTEMRDDNLSVDRVISACQGASMLNSGA